MIVREAVLHIPLSQYAYAPDESRLTLRLRAARNNLSACIVHYGNRAQDGIQTNFTPFYMQIVAHDALFDYYEATITPGFRRVCYYFELVCADETVIYCADLFMNTLPPTRSEFYQYPYIRREEISDVPHWFKHAVVYNIFPDSFASGKRTLAANPHRAASGYGITTKSRLGGTIRGVIENLDYIKALGFNCIYLNPIFAAGEYHKYDLIDYYHIDPSFGTDEDFEQLVDTAHKMGMRVIIDGVFNHSGTQFFAFQDVLKNGEKSQYVDWFYDLHFPLTQPDGGSRPNYSCFAYEPKMPKLNTSNPETRDYFMGVCKHWTRNYHIDGWRLDVANEVDREFWRAFRRTVKSENPECVMIGEIWESSENWLRGDMFDSTMNYDFRKNCRDFFANETLNAAEFHARTTQMRMRYPEGIVQGQLNLLDSHDVSRFLSLCDGDARRFQLAVVFLMTFPGVPSVFYGDEMGILGDCEDEYRAGMPWGQNGKFSSFFQDVTTLRSNEAVISGNYTLLYAEPDSHLYAFTRATQKQKITVLLNAGAKPESTANLDLPKQKPFLSDGFYSESIDGYSYAVWVESIS